ncbi:MAG: hypothetical protein SGJ23_03700 [Alphaproteobacteria bacterium]|nr:hypothetical protein [Alphaproteobacteria bacterium]
MRCVTALFSALLLTACATTAPVASDAPHAPATAEGIIAASNAQRHYSVEASGDPGYVQARNRESGLRCRFDVRYGGSIHIYDAAPGGGAPGDDTSCNTPIDAITVTYYATRYTTPTTTAEQAEAAIAAIRERFDVLSEIAPTTPDRAGARTRSFRINYEGKIKETRVSVAMVDGWVLKMRFTGPQNTLPLADRLWADVLADFEGAGRAARPGV